MRSLLIKCSLQIHYKNLLLTVGFFGVHPVHALEQLAIMKSMFSLQAPLNLQNSHSASFPHLFIQSESMKNIYDLSGLCNTTKTLQYRIRLRLVLLAHPNIQS